MPNPAVSLSPDALLAFLKDPASYPYPPERIAITQTHISYVAIAPPHVYKVKKPVDLGFLDFSTLDRQRHFCEEEVRLNRRLCPNLYEGVVPITRTDDRLQFGEGGEAVAYAVKMHYLPDDGFLHRRLEHGTLTKADLDRVVDALVAFYRRRQRRAEVAEWGWIEKLRVNTDENAAQTEAVVGDLIAAPVHEALRYYNDWFYAHHTVLLNERRVGGAIVEGHGDLRLEHIHLTPERVCIYDCIEFSERLRCLDVANDIGFLAMDLDVQGRIDLGWYVARQIAARLDDPDMLRLIDFYKSYRAYVRGKVEAMRSAEAEVPEADRAAGCRNARFYFRWALQYAVVGARPLVLVVMGAPGTGKSTQAEALAEAFGWAHVSSDRVRKQAAGVPLDRRSTPAERERLYTPERTAATYEALQQQALTHAGQANGVVLDATYSHRTQRDALRRACREQNVPCVFIELTAPEETLRSRLQQREGQSGIVSDARLEDIDTLLARYEAPDALEDGRHLRVSTEATVEATTAAILKALIRLELGANQPA